MYDTPNPRTPQTDPPDDMRDHPAVGRPKSLAAAIEPLLIGRRELARLLSRSLASLDRDAAAGRLPRPLRIGASVRWRLSEIQEWVAASCPDLKTWEAMRRRDLR